MSTTRREAIAAAIAAGAALALPEMAVASSEEDDARAALGTVFAIEQTALVAYEAIANNGVLKDTLKGFVDQERQHCAQIQAELQSMGAKPPIPPRRTDIPGLHAALGSRRAALTFAIALEERAIGAYEAAIGALIDPNFMRTSAGAMGTDAQHLVILRQLAGLPPVPGPFERGRSH
jgi:rubrerythrin